jgi:hypothetical protein
VELVAQVGLEDVALIVFLGWVGVGVGHVASHVVTVDEVFDGCGTGDRFPAYFCWGCG